MSKYCEEIEGKIEPLLANKKELSDSEMEKFGQKDPASYPNILEGQISLRACSCDVLDLFLLKLSSLLS